MTTIYLLHFDQPIAPGRHSCQHYIGSADDLDARLRKHQHSPDARLLQVAKQRGISFDVVRTWQGDRQLERKLKNQKQAPMLCPICRNERKRHQWQLSFLDEMLLSFTLDDLPELAF